MLQPALVQQILEAIGEGEYVGTRLGQLYKQFVGDDVQAASENEYLKFVYHMDEIYDAGLIKNRDLKPEYRWGQSRELGGGRSYANVHLILTPVGAEVLKELNKPKGLERLIQAVRSAGAVAGQEALKYGISELFKGSVS
ncbi:MAG: hypothetical protein COA87_007925 [Halomonas sp.]|nr:hypothetical protein [Halomonas sp.]MBL1267663.1 hypothetical protein [Halomonas sp.]